MFRRPVVKWQSPPTMPETPPSPSPVPPHRDTPVQLAPRLKLELAGPLLRVEVRGEGHDFPRSLLPLLAYLETSHTLQEALDWLARDVKGPAGLLDAFGSLLRLGQLGVLEGLEGSSPARADGSRSPFGPPAQIRMLEDRARTSAFLEAVRRTVKPGSVVVDLGTGTGILALAAAQAGARRVYALEANPIAETAQRLFEASGLGDRITLLRGFSHDLELPEKADVLVSEIIGHDPLGEGILEAMADAVARLLKPGAALIPASIRILTTPVEVPARVRSSLAFSPARLRAWERRYGLPLRGLEAPPPPDAGSVGLERHFVQPGKAAGWRTLGPGGLAAAHDLAQTAPARRPATLEITLSQAGRLGGFLDHWEADLAPGVQLSTAPGRVDRWNHWRVPLWCLPRPLRLERGARLQVTVSASRAEATMDRG